MKLRNLFLAVVAGAAMLVGCDKEVDFGPAKLALDQTALTFEVAGGSQSISVTSSRDWAAVNIPDWVALSATSGKAAVESQPVRITVAQNSEYNRSATIVFTIGFARTALTINQAGPEGEIDNGDGTQENPFNVAGVVEYVNALGADVPSPEKVFVAGIISSVDEEFNTQYGNGAFKISDDGSTTGAQFTAYRVLYLGNKKFTASDTQIKVGDEVIVYGNVVNYKGNTPETQQNSAFLYSLNGENRGGIDGGGSGETGEPSGTGTVEDPFNVAAAINAVKNLTWTSTTEYDKVGPYYVKGIVKTVSEAYSTQYGNGNFYIKDADVDNQFYVFRALYLGNKKYAAGDAPLAEGDEVIIYGELMNYRGNTPETVQNSCYLYSLNGNTGGGSPVTPSEPKGSGTEADPYNPAGANAFISTLAADAESENDVYIKGIISSIQNQYAANDYGNANFYITEDGKAESESFYCFRVLYLQNQKFTEGDAPVNVGDEVVICGKVVNYKGNTPETAGNKAYLYSLVPGEGGGDQPGGDETEYTYEAVTGSTIKVNNEISWSEATDATYGKGFEAVSGNIKLGLYKHESNVDVKTPDQYSARVYVSSVFVVSTVDGSDLTAIEFTASDPYNGTDYAQPLKVLEGGNGTVPANTETKKIGTWKGSASKVVFQATPKQARLFSMTYAPGDGGGDQPGGGDDPSAFETDLSKVIALADASNAAFEAVVAGVTSNSFVVTDGTNNLYVYRPATMAAIGDKVQVVGTKKTYGGVPEIDTGATVTVVSGGNTVSYGNVKDITASFDNYPGNASTSEYISFTGTLAKSGNYYNVTVEGATTNVGSISNPVSSLDLASLDGQKVKFTGFYVGFSSSKYVNMACIAAEAVGGDEPGGGDQPGGGDPSTTHAGTQADPFSVSDALASVANLTWTSQTDFQKVGPYYVKGTITSIKYPFDAQHGTATFDISDAGGLDKFTCYSVKYFGGEAWVEGNTQVAIGDEVIIYGELQNYQGNTPETVSEAYVYSINGKTSDEPGGGDQPGGGDEPAGTAYVLDKDAITAAHTSAWAYTSGSKTVTATDGSEWTLYNTYADKNQVTVQMNKGKGAYVLTPALPAGMEVKTIAVVLNTKKDGTGNMGDRPMDILNADGSSTLLAEQTGQTLADGVAVASGNSQVRIICNEAKGGAVYITSITVTYGAAE